MHRTWSTSSGSAAEAHAGAAGQRVPRRSAAVGCRSGSAVNVSASAPWTRACRHWPSELLEPALGTARCGGGGGGARHGRSGCRWSAALVERAVTRRSCASAASSWSAPSSEPSSCNQGAVHIHIHMHTHHAHITHATRSSPGAAGAAARCASPARPGQDRPMAPAPPGRPMAPSLRRCGDARCVVLSSPWERRGSLYTPMPKQGKAPRHRGGRRLRGCCKVVPSGTCMNGPQ